MIQVASDGISWDIIKSVMLTLTTMGVAWISRTVFMLRDDVRDLKKDVSGVDGKNGMKSDVRFNCQRLDALEDRNIRTDAIDEIERNRYSGDDRREHARRLRDKLAGLEPHHDETDK